MSALRSKVISLLFVALCIPVLGHAQGGTWTTKASMPAARWGLSAGSINGILYVVGGVPVNNTCSYLPTLEAYNPATDTWSTKASMPTGRESFGVGVVNNTLYVVGGGIGCGVYVATNEAYDPVSNTWTTKAPMPSVRRLQGVGVVNGILYAVGGHDSSGILGSVVAYDPVSDTWALKAPIPTPRAALGVGVVNGVLYAVGGVDNSGLVGTVEAYDPVLNTWTTKAPMPGGRYSCRVEVVNGILYAVGGSNNTGYIAEVDAYNPVTNSWTTVASIPTPRTDHAVAVANGVLYAVGGHNGNPLATNEAFTPTPSNQPPVANGKIAFASNRDGDNEIYVMNADGSGVTQLTNNSGDDQSPAWSADGTKIAFRSDRDGTGDIYVMNADGTGQTRLTNNLAEESEPTWSPDGTKIAFQSNRDGNAEIYVMDAVDTDSDGNGDNPANRTNNPADDVEPAWSPDGTKILFDRDVGVNNGRLDIFVMNADGSGQTRLTFNPLHDSAPSWSPDGLKIAFESDAGHIFVKDIYVINADGSGQTNLTTNNPAGHDGAPAWSPDGTKIAFRSDRDGNLEIYVMNADGSGVTRLTNNPAFDSAPDWQPLPNRPPVANAGPDQTVEATSAAGASVTLNGSGSSDPDGDTLTYTWTGPFGTASGVSPTVTMPLGTNTITLSVDDGNGHTATATTHVTVQDTTPPLISGTPADIVLEATNPVGAVASWTSPTATDLVDGVVPVFCSPASGSTFAIGTEPVSCFATDAHSNTATVHFNVTVQDTTPPTIDAHGDVSAEATSPAGAIVTYTSPATHDLVDGTGTASCLPASGSQFALGDSPVHCSATDAHGNPAAPTSFTVHVVDTTRPTLSCGSPDGLWHASDVSIACTASDIVGLAHPADASFQLSTGVPAGTETANAMTSSHEVCDTSANCVTAGPIGGNKVDKKAPGITINAPANGASYALNQAVASNYACADGGSGGGSCSGPVASGANFNTGSLGAKSFTVTATDAVSNTAMLTSNYSVVVYNFIGFLPPIRNDGSAVFKRSQTVPIKFQLTAPDASFISNAIATLQVFQVTNVVTGSIEEVTNADGENTIGIQFRFDPLTNQYFYNLKLRDYPRGTYLLRVTLNDGTIHEVRISVK